MGNAKAYKSKETKLHGMPQRWVGVRRAAHDTGRDGACYGIGDGECKAEWDNIDCLHIEFIAWCTQLFRGFIGKTSRANDILVKVKAMALPELMFVGGLRTIPGVPYLSLSLFLLSLQVPRSMHTAKMCVRGALTDRSRRDQVKSKTQRHETTVTV
ncbi:hypothetical protein Naga_100280g4 [Nannochloropsis gaditana]|uniref:Uncharacterized protein n=1 Tax=Nannochloropsis gaditana TaxID=72520 RepID=W7TUS1_9STRA|nr:hypothetical protein Naga_100280g4 [Nannochloropsis gaditana]